MESIRPFLSIGLWSQFGNMRPHANAATFQPTAVASPVTLGFKVRTLRGYETGLETALNSRAETE